MNMYSVINLSKQTLSFILVALCLTSSLIIASEDGKESAKTQTPIPELVEFVSEHSAKFNGQKVIYKAVAGEVALNNNKLRGNITG